QSCRAAAHSTRVPRGSLSTPHRPVGLPFHTKGTLDVGPHSQVPYIFDSSFAVEGTRFCASRLRSRTARNQRSRALAINRGGISRAFPYIRRASCASEPVSSRPAQARSRTRGTGDRKSVGEG